MFDDLFSSVPAVVPVDDAIPIPEDGIVDLSGVLGSPVVDEEEPTELQLLGFELEKALAGRNVDDIPINDNDPYHVARRNLQKYYNENK